jgi:GntR family transcriptional regulator
MDSEWNDGQPIHRQLRDRLVSLILDGLVKEGDALPSVRTIAVEYRINPLTAMKGFQHLVDEQLVEVRRGLGMFVLAGARERLREDERRRFLAEEWPRIQETIRQLGLSAKDLLDGKPAEAQ